MIRTIAEKQHLDMKALNACVERQDTAEIDRSLRDGRALGVGATPTMFINGAKIEGAVPVDFLFKIIDAALLAEIHEPSSNPLHP